MQESIRFGHGVVVSKVTEFWKVFFPIYHVIATYEMCWNCFRVGVRPVLHREAESLVTEMSPGLVKVSS